MQLEEYVPQIDPRIKPPLRDELMQRIYAPMQFRHTKMVDEIIKANCDKTGALSQCFLYKGKHFVDSMVDRDWIISISKQTRYPLDATLHAEMDAYLDEAREVREEKPFVSGCITAVLNVSNAPQDWLRLLPEALHGPILPVAAQYPLPARLSDQKVEEFLLRYAGPINKMRSRLVLNMLL